MQFSEVIGHKEVKEQLVQMVQQNRLSHSLLFLGKEGAGGLPLALAFAQYIICSSSKANESSGGLFGAEPTDDKQTLTDSCGVCASCQKANKLIHPDIHFSYPVIAKKSGEKPIATDFINQWREFIEKQPYSNEFDWLQFIGAENKQGNITAAECNDINRKLSFKAFEGQYKILVMWMPEQLGKEGNKLLKLIEEPPPDTIFIFVAENDEAILPTILSRTQLVKIPAYSNKEIADALLYKANVAEEKARQIAGICEGNYREALLMLQHAEEDWQEIARQWLSHIVRQKVAEQVKWVEDISKLGREKQKQFLGYFIHLIEQAVRISVIDEAAISSLNIPHNEMDFGLRLNKISTIEGKEAMINELNKYIYYIERNAHPKLLFHALSIRLSYIIKENSLILVN
jgi:DNA polymerase III subunit delta'